MLVWPGGVVVGVLRSQSVSCGSCRDFCAVCGNVNAVNQTRPGLACVTAVGDYRAMSLNQRQEAFAQGVVETGNLTRAYREAGYSANNDFSNAHRLSRKEQVASRIAQGQNTLATCYLFIARPGESGLV
jgi:hypothetical protein